MLFFQLWFTLKPRPWLKHFLSLVVEYHFKALYRSTHPDVFLGKGILKICSKFTREYPCRSAFSIKLLCNFVEITLLHGCYVNLLHIFRTLFLKNTCGWMLLIVQKFLESFIIVIIYQLHCSLVKSVNSLI